MLPFFKQAFVTLGVNLNSLAIGLIGGFIPILSEQLRSTEHVIPTDDDSLSWIASINGAGIWAGVLLTPIIMGKFGRRIACLTCAGINVLGWLLLYGASSLHTILFARFLQGLPMGCFAIFGAATVGEYTSPKYRGLFIGSIPLLIFIGVLIVRILGSVLIWRHVVICCALFGVCDIIIILCSPETPTFLASKGKFDKSRKAYNWLRGLKEEEEIEKIIKRQKIVDATSENTGYNVSKICKIIFQKEFYKPIFIMFHLHLINEWSGGIIYDTFTYDIYRRVVGFDKDVTIFVLATDIQRTLSSMLAMYFIKRVGRRRMLFSSVCLNIAAYLLTSAYVCVRTHYVLPFDHPSIGAILVNLIIFSTAVGTIPIPNILAGEIFPLKYKEIGSAVTMTFLSLNFFVNAKIMLFLLSSVGLHGAYCLFACIVGYGAIVSWFVLPETKDKTLIDIEDHFKSVIVSKPENEPIC